MTYKALRYFLRERERERGRMNKVLGVNEKQLFFNMQFNKYLLKF